MHIEQKIEVDGKKVTVTRTIQYADNQAAQPPANRPNDVLSKSDQLEDVDKVAAAAAAALAATSTSARKDAAEKPDTKGGQIARTGLRVFVLPPGGNLAELGPGGNLAELGPGGDLAGLGPGGNLASGLTLVFGAVNIECCHCHGEDSANARHKS